MSETNKPNKYEVENKYLRMSEIPAWNSPTKRYKVLTVWLRFIAESLPNNSEQRQNFDAGKSDNKFACFDYFSSRLQTRFMKAMRKSLMTH